MTANANEPRRDEHGRYSRISRRVWNDQKFRALSAPKPNAQTLFLRLLSGPENTNIPGLFQAWAGGLADAIGWPQVHFKRCFQELSDAGLVKADWKSGLVWIPNGVIHNPPANPNVVASWRATAKELPECQLLDEAFEEIREYLAERGEDWENSWRLAESFKARPAKIPTSVREFVRQRDGNLCRYCSVEVNWKDRRGAIGATYDHVDPTGDSSAENLVVCCRSCNSKKGFRLPEQAGMTTGSAPDKPKSDLGSDLGPLKSEPEVASGKQEARTRTRTDSQISVRLADRVVTFDRSPGSPPSPRRDPIAKRIPFADWFPSQQWLDWFHEAGINPALQDQTLIEARDKLTGMHDIEWWDMKILKFFESAIKRSGSAPHPTGLVVSL